MAASALAAGAQTLHQDIEVEQQTAPVKREAARITILPEVKLPPARTASLPYSSKVVSAKVPGVISTLEPARWTDPDALPDLRGYVTGSVFPLFNADLSAGYRLVDNDRTRLSLWGQYDGSLYHRGRVNNKQTLWRDHTATAGLDLRQTIGSTSALDAALDYTYGYHNLWNGNGLGATTYSHSSSRVNFAAAFSSKTEGLDYSARLNFNRFAFNRASAELTGRDHLAGQSLFSIGGTGALAIGETSQVALDADITMLRTSGHLQSRIPFTFNDIVAVGAATSGVVSVRPRFINRTRVTSVSVGAVMDVAIKSGKTINFAPDVTLAWMPVQIFGAEISAKGGLTLNTICSLNEGVTPYLNPTLAYGSSRLPYDLGGKLTFGPFLSVSVEAFFRYAKTDGWLMPAGTLGALNSGAAFERVDLKGYNAGVKLRYDNGRNVAVSAAWATAPSSQYRGWYEWRDRARNVIEAAVTIRPVKPLDVTAGFELRSGRKYYAYNPIPEVEGSYTYYPVESARLGTVANLKLSASYRYTKRLTLFASGENLLSRNWQMIGGRPAQGATGLVGASYKF